MPQACIDVSGLARQLLVAGASAPCGAAYRPERLEFDLSARICIGGRVVGNFVVQALRGEPLTICGDCSQTRSFRFVDDLIERFVRRGH